MEAIIQILSKFVDADKLGGWVRAGISALLGIVIAKWPGLSGILTPDMQASLGVLVAGLVVGIWSQLTKSDTAKVSMAAQVSSVTKIEVTDPKLAALPAEEVVLKK